MPKLIDLTGQKFGKLTVMGRAPKDNKKGVVKWQCLCDCGSTTIVVSNNLRSEKTKSCGCWKSELCRINSTIHGQSSSPLYACWYNMKSRCERPETKSWKDYGARGISVCDRWQAFENFKDDMLSTYFDGATIERHDVYGNYEPSNCKWIPLSMQPKNTRANVRYPFNGKMLLLSEIAELIGINSRTLHGRINELKWSLHDAFTIPTMAPSQGRLHSNCRYEYNGSMLLLTEIATMIGIPVATLRWRINIAKWPINDAFNTPVLHPTEYHLHKFKGSDEAIDRG